MRNRVSLVVVTLATLLALAVISACGSTIAGRADLGSTTGKTLGVPGTGSSATRSITSGAPQTTVPATTSTPPAPSTPVSPRSTDTTTEYTTIFTTEVETPDPADGPSPADVIGAISMGPNANGYLQFQSPTGNIFCGVFEQADFAEARCDIVAHSYPDPPTQDCGQTGFSTGAATVGPDGPGVVGICAGDTVADPASPVLAYGRNAGTADFACHSAADGMTCANLVTGHGFRLARAAYLVF